MKIDIVITWVDGNDSNWQKEKNKYLKKEDSVNNLARFRDWDNLQYIFRGIEKYLPWVNKVFFVTWGHLPSWLNISNPKLVVVNHKDFIPEEYLPTFNSHTIELNLHRIKGLSEHFIYFNDDTFVLKNIKPEDFFKKGLPCDTAVLNPIICMGKDHFSNVSANNMTIINENFSKRNTIKSHFFKWYNFRYGLNLFRTMFLIPWSKFPGFYNGHLPNAYLKSSFEKVWQKEQAILNDTCQNHLRNNYTNVNQWLIKYWQFASNNFYPRSPKIGKYFEIGNNNKEIIKTIINQKYKMICLNDSINIKNFAVVKDEINSSLQQIFPDKSTFEK